MNLSSVYLRRSGCLYMYTGPTLRPQAARWAQCTYIDIHFFSSRQKTSSSITQIRPDSNACDYLNTRTPNNILAHVSIPGPHPFDFGAEFGTEIMKDSRDSLT